MQAQLALGLTACYCGAQRIRKVPILFTFFHLFLLFLLFFLFLFTFFHLCVFLLSSCFVFVVCCLLFVVYLSCVSSLPSFLLVANLSIPVGMLVGMRMTLGGYAVMTLGGYAIMTLDGYAHIRNPSRKQDTLRTPAPPERVLH